jgi:hypothetical protein
LVEHLSYHITPTPASKLQKHFFQNSASVSSIRQHSENVTTVPLTPTFEAGAAYIHGSPTRDLVITSGHVSNSALKLPSNWEQNHILVKHFVRHKLFPKVKFITTDAELCYTGEFLLFVGKLFSFPKKDYYNKIVFCKYVKAQNV